MNMKKFFQIILLIVLNISCTCNKKVFLFTSFHEPATEGLRFLYSYDGYNWKDLGGPYLSPQVGIQKVMRDPSIVMDKKGTFHLVWTSSWKGDRGFGYACSNDLINWSEQRFIPVMDFDTTTVNVWAPELFYEAEKDSFIIVWASTIPYKFEKGIEDEFNNHRLYYTMTNDFKNFSPTKLFFDPGFSCIDATIVKRNKNDYVLVFKDNTRMQRNLRVAFSNNLKGPYVNISEPFTKMYTEGPTVLKVKNEYIIFYDAYRDRKYGAVKTKDFKEFIDITNNIEIPEGHKHGTVIKIPYKKFKKLYVYAKQKFIKE